MPNPGSRRDVGKILEGDAAYAEARRLKFEAQREAIEMQIKAEREAAKKDGRFVEGRDGTGGKHHNERTLALIMRLADVYKEFGAFDDERDLLEEVVAGVETVKGKESVAYISAVTRLATCHGRMREFDRRLELLESVRPLLAKVFTTRADVPQVCAAMHHLADAYEACSRIEDQIECLCNVLTAQDELYGVDSDPVLTTTTKLSGAYICIGAYAAVVELLESRLPPLIERLTAIHPQIFVAWMHLAMAYGHVGRREDQLGLYEALCANGEEVFQSDLHPLMLIMRRNRAVAHVAAGNRVDEAIGELTDVVDSFGSQLGPRDPETFVALHALADALARAGRFRESLEAFDELVRRVKKEGLAGGLEDILSQRRRVAQRLKSLQEEGKADEQQQATAGGSPTTPPPAG